MNGRVLSRARHAWQWWRFAIPDNGLLGYLRHVRQFEGARRHMYRERNP